MTSRERSPSRTTLPLNIEIGSNSNKYINDSKNDLPLYKDYIIRSNICLHEENKDLKIANTNLTNDISEKVEEIDKYEEQIRYVGLLHNLALIKEKVLL